MQIERPYITNLIIDMITESDFDESKVWQRVDAHLNVMRGSKTYYCVKGDRYRLGIGKAVNKEKAIRCYKRAISLDSTIWQEQFEQLVKKANKATPYYQELVKLQKRETSIENIAMYKIGQTMFSRGNRPTEYFKWFKKSASLQNYDAFCFILAAYLDPTHPYYSPYDAMKIFSNVIDEGTILPDEDVNEMKKSIKQVLAKPLPLSENVHKRLIAASWQEDQATTIDRTIADLWNDVGVILLQNVKGERSEFHKIGVCFRRAANRGSPYGAYNLGLMYRYGIGGSRSNTKWEKWHDIAKEKGLPKKYCNMQKYFSLS